MLRSLRLDVTLAALLAAALWLIAAPGPASAGCGCDHPPAEWAPVVPPFASQGKTVEVSAPGADFRVGRRYSVKFDPMNGTPVTMNGVALTGDSLEAEVPDVTSGPTEITVEGPDGYSLKHSYADFTKLPEAPLVASEGGAYRRTAVQAAVNVNGTLLLPVNVRNVLDGMQFAFQLSDLPLEFGPDDVVIYNMDGIDLTLFTLAVDGQTEMQWGSYFGWEVEDDTGLFGVVYDTKVKRSTNPDRSSDVLTYWRHEFHGYKDAHLSCGTHEPDEDGVHPDGSLHIAHGHLVIAISGLKRSGNDPDDPSKLHALSPGKLNVDVNMVAVPAEGPIEPDAMLDMIESASDFEDFAPAESHYDEFQGFADACETGGGGKGKK